MQFFAKRTPVQIFRRIRGVSSKILEAPLQEDNSSFQAEFSKNERVVGSRRANPRRKKAFGASIPVPSHLWHVLISGGEQYLSDIQDETGCLVTPMKFSKTIQVQGAEESVKIATEKVKSMLASSLAFHVPDEYEPLLDEATREELSLALNVTFHITDDGAIALTGKSREDVEKAKKKLRKLFKNTLVLRLDRNFTIIAHRKVQLKMIAEDSDTRILIDDERKSILVSGTPEAVEIAQERLRQMYEMISVRPVDSEHTWFLLGPNQKSSRAIEASSGAHLHVSHTDSCARIMGNSSQIAKAKELIQAEVDKVERVELGSSLYAVAGKHNGQLKSMSHSANVTWNLIPETGTLLISGSPSEKQRARKMIEKWTELIIRIPVGDCWWAVKIMMDKFQKQCSSILTLDEIKQELVFLPDFEKNETGFLENYLDKVRSRMRRVFVGEKLASVVGQGARNLDKVRMTSGCLVEADWDENRILLIPRHPVQYGVARDMMVELIKLYPESESFDIDPTILSLLPDIEFKCEEMKVQCVVHPNGLKAFLVGQRSDLNSSLEMIHGLRENIETIDVKETWRAYSGILMQIRDASQLDELSIDPFDRTLVMKGSIEARESAKALLEAQKLKMEIISLGGLDLYPADLGKQNWDLWLLEWRIGCRIFRTEENSLVLFGKDKHRTLARDAIEEIRAKRIIVG